MKRSRMPDRTSEIARTSLLRTHAPVDRDVTPRSRSTGPTRARKTSQSAEEKTAKRLTRARSGGWCELRLLGICVGRAYDFSHRIAKGRGGKWTASNGCDSCRFCHEAITNTRGRRAEYERLGYIVRTGADTTQVPVLIAGRFVLLSDDGSTQDYQQKEA